MIEGWYVSAAAVKQFMAICGLPAQEEGRVFDRAARQLERACESARKTSERGPWQTWIAKATIRGRVERLELIVSTARRPEGPEPQLVEVRHKGRGRKGLSDVRRREVSRKGG